MTPLEAPGAPRTGEEVVRQACAACHATGLLGAPKIHDKTAWQQQLKTRTQNGQNEYNKEN